MKKLSYFKDEIAGLEDVSETIKAIEKVAASHIHFMKKEVRNFDELIGSLKLILRRMSPFYSGSRHPLFRKDSEGTKMLVILSGDKGLVGSLYHDLYGRFLEKKDDYGSIVVLGDKGKRYLESEKIDIEKSFVDFSPIPSAEEIEQVTGYVFNRFTDGKYASVDVLYPEFISLGEHPPTVVRLLPIDFDVLDDTAAVNGVGLPIFEPSKKEIFEWFITRYIDLFFYKLVMEAKLSELSSRTVEMEQAKKKTDELIKKTVHDYSNEQRKVVTLAQIERSATRKAISRNVEAHASS